MKTINTSSSKWEIVKNYINSHDSFTTKDMRKTLDGIGNSEYQYLLILTHVGFLEKPKLATYIRMAKIPEILTLSKCVKLSYDGKYKEEKQKLITNIKRKSKLNKIKNSSLE